MNIPLDRCRLVLVASPPRCDMIKLRDAFAGGDIASVIFASGDVDSATFSRFCEEAVPFAQESGSAAIVAEDSQLMGRTRADGLYLEKDIGQAGELIARFSPQKIVGCGGLMGRDKALRIGEMGPDFLLLGKIGRDIKPEPHPKNLKLAVWWAEFVEIPGIVSGGNSIESVATVAQTGIDFVLLEKAVFSANGSPGKMVEATNGLLDRYAPRFSEAEA